MNTFLNAIDLTRTENGMVARKSTNSAILDMFAFGGAYRSRTDEDVINLFKKAVEEDLSLAMKCLFYIRDVRGGQGERRFFRVAYRWLCENYPDAARRNLEHVAEYGRWDDILAIVDGTVLEEFGLQLICGQLLNDIVVKEPSLLAKWLPSENASSAETKALAKKVRNFLDISSRDYRKLLSGLRARIKVLERTMSAREWDKIEFDKLPSVAGLRYAKAFSKHPETAEAYQEFLKSDKKVNAGVLNPVDITARVLMGGHCCRNGKGEDEVLALQKYWENLKDYYDGREERGLCVVDVSGSMCGRPMAAAIGMGIYIAERGKGPFKDHFITFSERPELVKITGANIVEKIDNMEEANWGANTDIKKTMDLILRGLKTKGVKAEDAPTRLYIFSDMAFDDAFGMEEDETLIYFEHLKKVWEYEGYKLPEIVFWNLDARDDVIPAIGDGFSYISGNSMSMIECILSGKTGYDLMLDKLLSDRYKEVE